MKGASRNNITRKALERSRDGSLNVQNASADGDGYRMCPVIGLQLIHDILDVKVHCIFRQRELFRDLLIPITALNQSEHFHLTVCEILLTQMFGKAAGYAGRNMRAPGMHRTDDRKQLLRRRAFQDIS
jgi:hypothetical protein